MANCQLIYLSPLFGINNGGGGGGGGGGAAGVLHEKLSIFIIDTKSTKDIKKQHGELWML